MVDRPDDYKGHHLEQSCHIRLTPCRDPQDFATFRQIIDTYHTYKPWKRSPGRKICWLIESTGSELLGSIAVHSAVLVCKPRDDFIGWNREQKLLNLNKVANNYRFCLIGHGIGSRVLGLMEKAAKKEWKRKYGDKLSLLETFVQPPYQGTSYKAANWTYLDMTKGFAVRRAPVSLWKQAGGERERLFNLDPKSAAQKYAIWNGGKLVTVTPTPKKLIFVRPLHRYWKKDLLRGPDDGSDGKVCPENSCDPAAISSSCPNEDAITDTQGTGHDGSPWANSLKTNSLYCPSSPCFLELDSRRCGTFTWRTANWSGEGP